MNADDEEEQEHLPTLLRVQVDRGREFKEKYGWMEGCWRDDRGCLAPLDS